MIPNLHSFGRLPVLSARGELSLETLAGRLLGHQRSAHVTCLLILAVMNGPFAPARGDIDLADGPDALIYGDRFPGGAGDLAGWDIAAGDLDGDGVLDLLISAPYADGPNNTRWSTMDLYLYFGRDAGSWGDELAANATADVIFYGGYNPGTGDSNFPGWDVSCGDIDGDGIDDLAFSAPHADGPYGDRNATGAIYIYYGRPRAEWNPVYDTMGEVGEAADIEIYGADDNDSIGGRDLAGSMGANASKSLKLADITGDGRAEIIFGAVYADGPANSRNSCGDAYVVFGNTRDALTNLITVHPADPGRDIDLSFFGGAEADFFGFSVAVGDFDGDTFGDLAIGALYSDGPPTVTRNSCGDAYIFFGRPESEWAETYDVLAGDYDRWIQGRAENGHAPYRMAAGDIDGDGKADLVLSTPHNRIPVRPKAGEQQIVFGRERITWPQFIDLAVDADVWFQGRDNVDVWGTVGVERFEIGCDVSIADVDADGKADMLIGAKFGDSIANSRSNAGEALLVMGRDQNQFEPVYDFRNDPGIIAENIWGAETGVTGDFYHYDAAGHSVLLADLTGDGKADLILSAPFADGPGNAIPEAGETYLIFNPDPANIAGDRCGRIPRDLTISLAPNPSPGRLGVSFNLSHAAESRLEIFDAQGRRIRKLLEGCLPTGPGRASWDGRDESGQPVPSGVYVVRFASSLHEQAIGRVLIAR